MLKRLLDFNASRYWLKREMIEFARTVPANALVLDAGAGDSPYRPLFAHCRYEAADFVKVDKPYAAQTYICDLTSIPVEAERFDCVIFNQVMEHVPEPELVLRELRRVLKPGGVLFYSAPLFYEEHEQPYDFYRYTQFGVRYLFTKAGLSVRAIHWLEGYFCTAGYQLRSMARHLPAGEILKLGLVGLLLWPFLMLMRGCCFMISILFQLIDTRHRFTGAAYPKNYFAIAERSEIGAEAAKPAQ
ncbi:MAG TPA: class I SAM-dependent methyltransferase [Aliidongia sp.]|nr:class I SAM-dependent methyltransferase [Aliidongia sp.]